MCRVLRQKLFWCSHSSNCGQNLCIFSVREFTYDHIPQLSGKTLFLLSNGLLLSCFLLLAAVWWEFVSPDLFVCSTISGLGTESIRKRTRRLSFYLICSFEFSTVDETRVDTAVHCWVVQNTVNPPQQLDLHQNCIIWGLKYCLNFVLFFVFRNNSIPLFFE